MSFVAAAVEDQGHLCFFFFLCFLVFFKGEKITKTNVTLMSKHSPVRNKKPCLFTTFHIFSTLLGHFSLHASEIFRSCLFILSRLLRPSLYVPLHLSTLCLFKIFSSLLVYSSLLALEFWKYFLPAFLFRNGDETKFDIFWPLTFFFTMSL